MTVRFKPKLRDTLAENALAMHNLSLLYGVAAPVIPPIKGMPQSRLPQVRTIKGAASSMRSKKSADRRVSEADVVRDIRAYSNGRNDCVLWRNNQGEVQLDNGGRLRYGVGPNGASDFIGFRQVAITPEMVGSTIAQFVACEAKAPDAGTPPDHQLRFIDLILKAGGIAFVARCAADVADNLPEVQ